MRQLVVCVDDFGLHDGVNQAVFELLGMRRISAVSCLVDGPAWPGGVPALRRAIREPGAGHGAEGGGNASPIADVGLHLNFTEMLDADAQRACPPRALGDLIRAAYARRLDPALLRREVARQWDRFVQTWGSEPDFIDGHQHVHQLPQIRDALFDVLRERAAERAGERPWLRQCRSPGWRSLRAGIGASDAFKAAVIELLGSHAVGRKAGRMGWPCSTTLLGVYPFDADASAYADRWRAWLRLIGWRGDVLMCHPAALLKQEPPQPDPIGRSRVMELGFLRGPMLGRMLDEAAVRISRFDRARPT